VFEVPVWTIAFSVSVMRTAAFGTELPLWSEMVPLTLPTATACPNIAEADKKISTRTVVMRDIS
jgi:hypothetical protein